ncbi:hypothetical protein C8R44DRAFT_725657 [Mycena epipterygia]|nr:hypothetical protein C8R44DRAFT_725657 [Mycena epipterygia]
MILQGCRHVHTYTATQLHHHASCSNCAHLTPSKPIMQVAKEARDAHDIICFFTCSISFASTSCLDGKEVDAVAESTGGQRNQVIWQGRCEQWAADLTIYLAEPSRYLSRSGQSPAEGILTGGEHTGIEGGIMVLSTEAGQRGWTDGGANGQGLQARGPRDGAVQKRDWGGLGPRRGLETLNN